MSSSRPAFTPARSVSSWKPSSIRSPAHAWQRPSVGSCWPSEITHGQKTMQLHERTKSPLSFQLSFSGTPCSLPCSRRPVRDDRTDNEHRTDHDEDDAERVREAGARVDFLDGHDGAEHRHPEHVHHAHRKHQPHHRPAAAKAVNALAHAEPEYTARFSGPVGEEEAEWMLALRHAGSFKC